MMIDAEATFWFGGALIALSIAMAARHFGIIGYREPSPSGEQDAKAQEFRKAQYTRRSQACLLIGLLGLALVLAPRIPQRPLPMVVYLLSLVLGCGLLLWLGIGDWIAGRQELERQALDGLTEQMKEEMTKKHMARQMAEGETPDSKE